MNKVGNDELKDCSISLNKLDDNLKNNIDPYILPTSTVANVYVATIDKPILTKGLGVYLEVNVTNTGNCTLNLNSWGDIPILDTMQNQIPAGTFKKDVPYHLKYNGSSFILQGKGGGGNAKPADLLLGKTAYSDFGPILGELTIELLGGLELKTDTGTLNTILIPSNWGKGGYYADTYQINIPKPDNSNNLIIVKAGDTLGVFVNYKGIYINNSCHYTKNTDITEALMSTEFTLSPIVGRRTNGYPVSYYMIYG